MSNRSVVAVFDTARDARAAVSHLVEAKVPSYCIHGLYRNPTTTRVSRSAPPSRTRRRRAVSAGAVLTVELSNLSCDDIRQILSAHHPRGLRIVDPDIMREDNRDEEDFIDSAEMTEYFPS